MLAKLSLTLPSYWVQAKGSSVNASLVCTFFLFSDSCYCSWCKSGS